MHKRCDGRNIELTSPGIQSTLETRRSHSGQNRGRYCVVSPERILIARHLPTPFHHLPVPDWRQVQSIEVEQQALVRFGDWRLTAGEWRNSSVKPMNDVRMVFLADAYSGEPIEPDNDSYLLFRFFFACSGNFYVTTFEPCVKPFCI
jgi:hypothetical protein